jgi:hypothetical protein
MSGPYGPGGKYGDPPELSRAAKAAKGYAYYQAPAEAWCYLCSRKGQPALHRRASCPQLAPPAAERGDSHA